MKRLLIIGLIGCCLALTACGQIKTGIDPVAAAAEVQKVEDRYLQAKQVADFLMPFLSVKAQERIRHAETIIEDALVAARIATTEAARKAALDKIAKQTAVIEEAAPVDPD